MPDRPPLAGSFLDKARMTFKASFHFENVALALTAIQKGRVVGFEAFGPRTYSASRPAATGRQLVS